MAAKDVTDAMADRAIEWFARLRADDVGEADRYNFVEWLREDRSHQVAFIEILNLWEDLAVVKTLDFEEVRPFVTLWDEKEKARGRLVDLAG
ncbi:MAG: FecR/PupR family sigma factor regulator [Gammaproteobacteria bacterium]|jgi:ferric-dicitrate binding protein FerR (iron transport regulator)|nr:FecR/PupR family sigma factor regulator [Gammaproteobacteria bacterium]MBT4492212.1 FecR/PupR family sigma factor regulator [Gammaproteobacteria bacterium]MBT7370617.1 FecR/PupR family sigma factor regulator [Gammaproteobacteria bacterium]